MTAPSALDALPTGVVAAAARPGAGPAGSTASAHAQGSRGRADAVAVAATATVMLLVGLWRLNRGSLWGDEAVTTYAAHLSRRQLLHLLAHVDAVHGLYYALMHVVVKFGDGEVALRLPSVLGMAVAVGLTTLLGIRLASRAVGVLAGLLMACTPLVSSYAQDARSYALVTAAAMGACVAFAAALKPRATVRTWVTYGALLTLAGYLNEISLLIVLAHAATLLLMRTAAVTWRRWAAAATAGCVLVVPLLVLSTRQAKAVQRIHRPQLSTLFDVLRSFFGTSAPVCMLLAGCAVLGAVPVATGRRRRSELSLPLLAVPLALVPPVVLFVQSVLTQPLFVPRYLLYSQPGAVLLAAAGIYRLGRLLPARSAWIPGLAACLCCVALQGAALAKIRTPDGWRQNFAAAANYVAHRGQPGDAVIFVPHSFRWARLGYPRQYRQLDDVALSRSPQQSGTLNGTNKTHAQATKDMLTHHRIWVIGRPMNNLTPFDALQLALVQTRYHLVSDKHFHGVEVRRYDR